MKKFIFLKIISLALILTLGCTEQKKEADAPNNSQITEANDEQISSAVLTGMNSIYNVSQQGANNFREKFKLGGSFVAFQDGAPETINCGGGGNFDIANNDTNFDGQPSVGDTITINYNNCQTTAGQTLSGTFSLQLQAITITPSVSFTANITLTNLTVSNTNEELMKLSGNLTLSASVAFISQTTTGQISGTKMDMTVNGKTNSFSNFSFAYSFKNPNYSFNANGTAALSGQDGSVTFQTTTDFTGTTSSIYPTGGTMVISAGNKSRITITISGENIIIDTDINGDGKAEKTETKTWTTLTN